MARVVLTSAVILPASGGQPAVILPRGVCLEVTAAQAAAIAGAGGTTRNVSTMNATAARDQLGLPFAASNATP